MRYGREKIRKKARWEKMMAIETYLVDQRMMVSVMKEMQEVDEEKSEVEVEVKIKKKELRNEEEGGRIENDEDDKRE